MADTVFDMIAHAYERSSIVLTTNMPFEGWTEILGCERFTGAVLRRSTHSGHIIETRGLGYRLDQTKRHRIGCAADHSAGMSQTA
jgi:DNA replication protein DnaC